MRIVVIGAGGHGRVVADMIRASARHGRRVEFAGYLDDGLEFDGGTILGPVSALSGVPHDAVVVAIGDNQAREDVSERLRSAGERIARVSHPSALVLDEVRTGEGAMLCAGSIACTSASLGRGVILNTGSSVDHHSRIGDYAHIAPGVRIGGDVSVGNRTLVGIGAIVLPRITIGHDVVIGAGAVVTRDVPPNVVVTGIPARTVKRRPHLTLVREGLGG